MCKCTSCTIWGPKRLTAKGKDATGERLDHDDAISVQHNRIQHCRESTEDENRQKMLHGYLMAT